MKISARNRLKCTVEEIQEGAVNGIVVMNLHDKATLKADITMDAIKDLELAPGKEACAVIKATNVLFAKGGKIANISARNQLTGTITELEKGAVNGRVTIQLGPKGTCVSGTITNDAIDSLGLAEGDEATAIIKATDVLVAVCG